MKRWQIIVFVSLVIVGLFLLAGGTAYLDQLLNRPPEAVFTYRTATRTLEYIAPTDQDLILFLNNSTDPDGDSLTSRWYVHYNGTGSWQLLSFSRDCTARLTVSDERGHEIRLVVSDGTQEASKSVHIQIDSASIYSTRGLDVQYMGVNYFLGYQHTGSWGAPSSEEEIDESLRVIRDELGANAIKIGGDQEDAMLRAADKAVRMNYSLVVLSPRYAKSRPDGDGTLDEHLDKITSFSKRVEALRTSLRTDTIVLCVGEELTHSVIGISNSSTYRERCAEIYLSSGFAPDLSAKINNWLAKIIKNVRENYHGRIVYSSSYRDTFLVDWSGLGIDFMGPMIYFAGDESEVLQRVVQTSEFGKPVYVTEVGCSTFEGASGYCGSAWEKYAQQPYSELDQAQALDESLQLLSLGGVDGIFVYTWVERESDDAISYGIMRWSADGLWRRKLGFYALQSFRRELSPLNELPEFSLDGRQVTIEAENLLLGTPYQTATIGSDAASGRRYVENPSIAFTVILKEDSALTFSGLVRGPGEFNNSFWVRIDRGPLLLWDIPIQDQFVWDLMHDRGKLPSATQLAAGTHMVLVFTRESGSQIEALRINAS